MTNDKTYNGWSNYETWVVKLWMDNEQGTYSYWLEEAETVIKHETDRDSAIRVISDSLKDQHEEAMPEVTGVFADLLGAAMSEVDWREIATALVDDYVADNPETFASEESEGN